MTFEPTELVVKLSVSNMLKSVAFYTQVLGFSADEKYTINAGKNFGPQSYMQLNFQRHGKTVYALGLYKDIEKPYHPRPETGTVPSFIVNDIIATLKYFEAEKVVIDSIDGKIIISNTSDEGYVDHFFFFRDPDYNSLVIRQNFGRPG